MKNQLIEMKLIGCKVLGNWGQQGWDYGVIIHESEDTFGKDITIEWEDGRQQKVDVSGTVSIDEHTDVEKTGIYIDITGHHLSCKNEQTTEQHEKMANKKPSIHNYKLLGDMDKVKVLSGCLVDAVISINARSYSYELFSEAEKQRVKDIFFNNLNSHNIEIKSDIINKAKRLKWNSLVSLLCEFVSSYRISLKV